MSAPHTSLIRLVLVSAVVLLTAVPAAGAATTTPAKTATAPMGATGTRCWSDLIKDWYDGRIDKTYPVHCYRDALKHLPPDVRAYSDAYDVISRALAAATRGKATVDPNALIEPPGDQGDGNSTTTTTTGGGPAGGGGDGGGSAAPPLGQLPGDRGAGGIPVPLIVLGALAALLIAAGGAGLLVRRVQTRRGGPDAAA